MPYPMSKIVSEDEIAGERVGECLVEVEHFDQFVPFDGVKVAVRERPNVGARLANGGLLPEGITEHVSLA